MDEVEVIEINDVVEFIGSLGLNTSRNFPDGLRLAGQQGWVKDILDKGTDSQTYEIECHDVDATMIVTREHFKKVS